MLVPGAYITGQFRHLFCRYIYLPNATCGQPNVILPITRYNAIHVNQRTVFVICSEITQLSKKYLGIIRRERMCFHPLLDWMVFPDVFQMWYREFDKITNHHPSVLRPDKLITTVREMSMQCVLILLDVG